ncbi:MAG: zinc-binding dehydrogenase [Leptolyngbya sp. SIO4C1]|nr:zinc-binding dehydrogenase [Leptolyngbya sp. SIO4C1]
MQQVVVSAFGDIDTLTLTAVPTPEPAADEVLIQLTSIGMNHADLMARRGEYRLVTGEPPFTPGLEGGGVIVQVGAAVRNRSVGQRVILTLDAPASRGLGRGTYQSHYAIAADKTIPVPDEIPDELIGALWLPYLTAWGCLVWRQNLQPDQLVLVPAASSSVAIAASQVIQQQGGTAIGTTTSPDKVERLQAMPEAQYDHIVVTNHPKWWRDVKKITSGNGCDVIFDPVAAGDFLNHEIRLLAQGGTLWVYGLLGQPGVVDVTPLIRKDAAIRGWLLNQIAASPIAEEAYQHVLQQVAQGHYQLPVAQIFPLSEVKAAHAAMAQGQHIGKLILQP